MPMLTVRLSDEEMARLKELAGGNVAALVRVWIAAGGHTWSAPERVPMSSFDPLPDEAHPLKPARTERLQGFGLTVPPASPPSTLKSGLVRPGFLAAPDEDCVCGHDRHSYHLGGACSAFIRPKVKCPCPGFQADLGFE